MQVGFSLEIGANRKGRIALTSFRRVLAWHEDPVVITWWRTRLGLALRWQTPRRRRTILAAVSVALGAHYLLGFMPWALGGLPAATNALGTLLGMLAAFAFFWVCYVAAVRFASFPPFVRRHPQITLHLLFWCLLAFIWSTSGVTGWWGVAAGFAVIAHAIWRLGYLVLSGQRGKVAGTRFTDHLLYLAPYNPTPFAFGKGLDYLRRHEAQDEAALARSQLAGIKLLLLAMLWKAVLSALNTLVYGHADTGVSRALGGFSLTLLPDLGHVMAQGSGASIALAWASIYGDLVRLVLERAIEAHIFVGMLRLFGFNVFRNVYKPLLAQSIVEFWGRFNYYFKEVLVDFFFLPAYARWFRKHPALRLFVAVFAAAFVGNMYMHLLGLKASVLVLGDFGAMWDALHSRLFYCLLLTIGIFVSMRREQQRKAVTPSTSITRRIANAAGVLTFFALIHIWNDHPTIPFLTRTEFFLGLFGLA